MKRYIPTVMAAFKQDEFDAQLDRILDEAVRTFGTAGLSDQDWVPACNVWENESGFYVQVALPGWEANHIALEVQDQVLAIKGERRVSADNGRYHLQEIHGNSFGRIFRLPAFVDREKATATHKNGVLTIAFPKNEEAKPRPIQING